MGVEHDGEPIDASLARYIAAFVPGKWQMAYVATIPVSFSTWLWQNGQRKVTDDSIVRTQNLSYKFVGGARRPIISLVHLANITTTTPPILETIRPRMHARDIVLLRRFHRAAWGTHISPTNMTRDIC